MKSIEHEHQATLFKWAKINEKKYPCLALMFAIPNGGHRHIAVAKKLKAEGVKAGVPDIFLPVAKGKSHGLFIEMKAPKGVVSLTQKQWIFGLVSQCYTAQVCYGWEQAKDVIVDYLNGYQ